MASEQEFDSKDRGGGPQVKYNRYACMYILCLSVLYVGSLGITSSSLNTFMVNSDFTRIVFLFYKYNSISGITMIVFHKSASITSLLK